MKSYECTAIEVTFVVIMRRIILLILIVSAIEADAQKVSIGIRTGVSKWINTNLYSYTIQNPRIGNLYTNDYEIFVHYRTDKLFAMEAGNGIFRRKYKEQIRGNEWDISYNSYEIHYSMMWRIVQLINLKCYLGGDFSLVSDFRYEHLKGIKGETNTRHHDIGFWIGHRCLVRYQLSKHLDIQSKLTYKFDTDKLWDNKSPYANSKLVILAGVAYTF